MSTTPLVILVGGRLTSGKDAFADHLVAKHKFVKLGMSDTLAEALYRLNPLIPVQHPGPFGEVSVQFVPYQNYFHDFAGGYVQAKTNPEVRRLLQQLGTEVGRELLGQNIWVEAARKKILELTSAGHNVIITGIRFPNELELENQLNEVIDTWGAVGDKQHATSVYVDRPSLPAPVAGHSSEGSVQLEDFQYVLGNTGTLEDLYAASDALLGEIRDDYGV